MGEWRRVRIGDVCDIVKGETGLASATPGQYPMVATGAERRSCTTYQFDTEAVCIPLVSSTGHGKKTLNYVHYQAGKFALGTILAAVIPKDPKVLTARYLHLYLSHFKDTVLVPLMKGAANVSLPMKGIAAVEIPVPPVDQQQKLIDLIDRIESEHLELLKEGNRQADLFKQLRQAVLQEAVEGKLTADWRRKHPVMKGDPLHDAAALLAQITAEKERLVKAVKIRKEKPLPPIADSDKPFELPAGWVWCCPADLGAFTGGGTPNTHTKEYWDGDILWVTPKDMKVEDVFDSELKITEEGVRNSNATLLPPNTPIFVVRSGILKRTVPISICRVSCTINQDLKAWLLAMPGMADFVKIIIKGNELRILRDIVKKGMTVENFDFDKFKNYLIPLPPLAEQQAIVARVDSLMATIDALEAQVTERKEQAQLLMQAVLREAFAGGEGAVASVGANQHSLQTATRQTKRANVDSPLRTSTSKIRAGFEPAPTKDVPMAAEAPAVYAGGIPARILAAMQPGRDYSRAELLVVTGIGEADWTWAIRQLREKGQVVQTGEKRGARYELVKAEGGGR